MKEEAEEEGNISPLDRGPNGGGKKTSTSNDPDELSRLSSNSTKPESTDNGDDFQMGEMTVKGAAIAVNFILLFGVLYERSTLFIPWMIVYASEWCGTWMQGIGFLVIFQGHHI